MLKSSKKFLEKLEKDLEPADQDVRLAAVSLHAVWWRRQPVAWYSDPDEFEKNRPFTHRARIAYWILILLLATTAAWVFLPAPFGTLGILGAVGMTVITAIAAAAIAWTEHRFDHWVSTNDERSVLDDFRRPTRLHPAATRSDRTLKHFTKAGDPAAAFTSAVDKAAHVNRRLRPFSGPDYARLLEIYDVQPLIKLRDAAATWREQNEAWTEADSWDSEFRPPRWSRKLPARELETAALNLHAATREIKR